jgi:tetratricopeptide (TPR) repeat protein
VVARRTLTAALCAVVACSDDTPDIPRDPDMPLARSLAIVPSAPDSARHEAARTSALRIARALRSVAGLRVVATDAPGAIPRARLRELLNVGATLYMAAAADGSPRYDAVLRDAADSVLFERSYPFDVAEDAIATDAARVVRAREHLAPVGKIRVADIPVPEPHVARADSLRRARSLRDAEAEYRRAIRVDPQDARARARYSELLETLGHPAEALREARRAHELDPLSAELHLAYAAMLGRAGRPAEAARELAEQRRIASILNPTPEEHAKALSRRRARAAQRQRR